MKALEIWNEPNLTFYGMPAPDPAAYAAFLGAAHDAIKAADPTSAVITGGLAPAENQPRSQAMNPLLHVRAVYRAGGGKFDALGYHPYTYPAMLTDDPGDGPFVTTTPKLHDEMAKHGDRQSRCGARRWARPHSRPRGRRSWRSTSPGRTAAAIGGRSPALDLVLVSRAGTNPTDVEDNLGLVRADFVTKEPAFAAFEKAMRRTC